MSELPKSYTVRQGESLSKIGERFGINDWKLIYYASCNGALRLKRRDPSQIQPGDLLFIPLRQRDLRAHHDERLRRLRAIRAQLVGIYDEQLKELDDTFATVRITCDGVDAVKTLVDLGMSVRNASKIGDMMIGKHGKILKALNKELKEKAKKIIDDSLKVGIRDPLLEATFKDRDAVEDGVIWAIGRIAVETFLKYDSPSFWGWTFFQLKRGKSWTEAVSDSPEKVYNDCRAVLVRGKESGLRNIDRRIWEVKRMMMS